MKRLAPSMIFFALLLASCGGSKSTEVSCKDMWFDAAGMGTCLPDKWEILDRSALNDRGVPQDVIIAFQASDPVSGQFPTITVTREPLESATDPVTYSDATMRSVSVLPSFKLIDKRTVKIVREDGSSVSLPIQIFSAQPVQEEPSHRFYQLSTVSGGAGYAVTALTPLSVDSVLEAAVLKIVGSVTFLAPSVEKK